MIEKKPKKKNSVLRRKETTNKSKSTKEKETEKGAPVAIRPIRRIRPEVTSQFGKDL